MELRHLRYFMAVAEELHFTRAAARLQIAQPALSNQIRRLERGLGVELFVRSNRSVDLTDAGRVFLEHARRVLEEADRAQRAAEQAGRGQIGHLAIGFVPEAAAELVPKLLIAYRAQHPHVDIVLYELHTTPQIDALLDGQIHVGLRTHRTDDPRLHLKVLGHQRLVVAVPSGHRLAGRRSLRLRELASERWIHPGFGPTSVLFTVCAQAGYAPLVAQQASELEARLALVASGIGLTLLAESSPRLPGSQIVYLPLDRPKITIDLVAAWPKDRSSPLVDGFLAVADSTFRTAATTQRTATRGGA